LACAREAPGLKGGEGLGVRFETYLTEGKILNIIKNIFSRFARLKPKDVEYQLQSGWYDLVERARKEGREKEMVTFINKTFHQHLRSLDDVNMRRIKLAIPEATVLSTFLTGLLDYESVQDMSNIISNIYSLFTSTTNMESLLYTVCIAILALSIHFRHN
jgi:hypothetical protein